MKKIVSIVFFTLFASIVIAGTYTPNLNLYKPSSSEQNWGTRVNSNWDAIDLSFTNINSQTTTTFNKLFSLTIGNAFLASSGKYSTLNAIHAAAVASAGSVIIIDNISPIYLTSSLTTTVPIIAQGGIITRSSGTLTISGSFSCGLSKVFSGFTAGEVVFTGSAIKEVHPEWWGLHGDDATDDSNILQSAYDAAGSANATLILPAKTMKITTGLLFNNRTDVIGIDSEKTIIKKYGNIIGVKIGNTVNAKGQNQRYENFTIDGVSGAPGDSSVGIEVWSGSGIKMRDILVSNQGSHGIIVRSGFYGLYENIQANSNGQDGFRIEGATGFADSSVNANSFVNIHTIGNGQCGFRIIQASPGNSAANFGVGIVSEQNIQHGISIGDINNIFQIYAEQNDHDASGHFYDVYFDSTSIRNYLTINAIGSFLSKYYDAGTNNIILDIADGRYLHIPFIGAPFTANGTVGKTMQISGGTAGAGAAANVGGAVYITGGDGNGTSPAKRGGHVYIDGGLPNAMGSEIGTTYIQSSGGNFVLGKYGTTAKDVVFGTLTLLANSATTTVSNTSISTTSRIIITPTSANAAADQGSATGVYISSKSTGSCFIVSHPNNANAGKTFDYVLINPGI